MEVDEAVVDLSVSSRPQTAPMIENSHSQITNNLGRRVLRPRTEPRSYVEVSDFLINGDRPKTNGVNSTTNTTAGAGAGYTSDSSEGEMPPLAPIKELSSSELRQRERGIRRLREELRAEEMKLVLLKKLKQSQQLKENVGISPSIPASALPPTLPSGLSITPTTVKVSSKNQSQASSPHSKPLKGSLTVNQPSTIMRVSQPPSRTGSHGATNLSTTSLSSRGVGLSVPQPQQRNSITVSRTGFPPGVKDLPASVTITPAPPQPSKDRNMSREDNQTPAQRQAAAKLALRKQLEKTLLQIPPPKPPPPEMNFIPNPSNTEFIYLIGLEHVVDFLTTKDLKTQTAIQPFSCSQCQSDFTPVWKWEVTKGKGKAKEHKVICEQCVTTNVKKALKAEHTNRLKTAFVKALQQEQEIEQRLAQNGSFSSSPAPSPVSSGTPNNLEMPKSVTPTPVNSSTQRHATATPPTSNHSSVPTGQPTPPPQATSRQSSMSHSQSAAAAAKEFANANAMAAALASAAAAANPNMNTANSMAAAANLNAMQALHRHFMQSLASGPHSASAAHMLSPLLYPYQLAALAAQASTGGKGTPSMAEVQRAAEIQRQYLLDMIPPQSGGGGGGSSNSQRHNWKT